MFFILSKIGFFFLQPSNLLVFMAGLGVFLLWTRWRRLGRLFCAFSILMLAFIGLSPAANWLILPLEERFGRPALGQAVDGIVVLGGSFDTRVMGTRREPALTSSAERLTVVPRLISTYPGVPIVHTGGHGLFVPEEATEAEGAYALFTDFGIDPARVLLEDKSRNTHENAIFTHRLVNPKPGQSWLLVTSAYHMPRAIGVFRQAGWETVIAYPVDWRTRGWQDSSLGFSGLSSGLRRFDVAAREWIGLFAYWLAGKTSEFLPGPERHQ